MAITRRTFLKGLGAAVLTGCAAESGNIVGGKRAPYPDKTFGDSTMLPLKHQGLDYLLPTGTPIVAAANGIVYYSGKGPMGSENIFISHPNNAYTIYAHFSEKHKTKSEIVFRGMTIGLSGSTGTKFPHLHFQLNIEGPGEREGVDPNKGYWASGTARTYDGVTDYDKTFREGGKLQLSAPFVGPVPHGNVNLEKIVATATPFDITKFANNPEEYKQPLFEAAMKLIHKKYKPLAQDLAGLPILNDSITKQEALSVYKLWETIKDIDFETDNVPQEHAKRKKAIKDITTATKGERWNFYLQEMVRWGQEKDIPQLLQDYVTIPLLVKDMWK